MRRPFSGIRCISPAPRETPASDPITSTSTASGCTAPSSANGTTAADAVSTMAAKEVAWAACWDSPSRSRPGTASAPPPIPKSPDITPTASPRGSSRSGRGASGVTLRSVTGG